MALYVLSPFTMTLRLSPLQSHVLWAIAKYRFLTCHQMALLVSAHIGSLRRAAKALTSTPAKTPLVKAQAFPCYAGKGRLESVFTITSFGRQVAQETSGKSSKMFDPTPAMALSDRDYQHRIAVQTFRIQFDLGILKMKSNLYLETCYQYFDREPKQERHRELSFPKVTSQITDAEGKDFIPDSLFLVKSRTQSVRGLFALEMIFGHNTERSLAQIKRHMQAISERTLATKFNLPSDQEYLALICFDEVGLMNRVTKALENPTFGFQPFIHHFLFATRENAQSDIRQCWRKVSTGEARFDLFTARAVQT